MISVPLTQEEYDYYGAVGKRIREGHSANRKRGGPGSVDTFAGEHSEQVEIEKSMEAYRSEFAVAKFVGVPYDPDEGKGNGADVAGFIGVKWVRNKQGPLMVDVKNFNRTFVYILVQDSVFTLKKDLVGWLYGVEVEPYKVSDPGGRNKPTREIQRCNLRDMQEFLEKAA